MLTSQMIKDRAKELGIDDIGIGNIERFDNAPPLMSVKNYLRGAKSVSRLSYCIPKRNLQRVRKVLIAPWYSHFTACNKLEHLHPSKGLPENYASLLEISAAGSWCRITKYCTKAQPCRDNLLESCRQMISIQASDWCPRREQVLEK